MIRPARIALVLVLALAGAPSAMAQGVAFQLGRLFNNGGWTSLGAAWVQPVFGPAALSLGGTLMHGPAPRDGRLLGAMADLSLFRGGRPGAYAVAGVAGGFGTSGAEKWWNAWSAGVGYELIPVPFLSLGLEGRYREFRPAARSGLELSVRIGANFGAVGRTVSPAGVPERVTPALWTAGSSLTHADAARLLDGVIATADSAIGARYRLGGRGEDGRGFDCSGLIQYAYARHGIALPRTSGEQATRGREVGRELASLQPGDLLTFSSSGQGVTHVGLYVGDGRFIHSASSGVQTSRLSATDPYGKWWFKRWVGARRIVG